MRHCNASKDWKNATANEAKTSKLNNMYVKRLIPSNNTFDACACVMTWRFFLPITGLRYTLNMLSIFPLYSFLWFFMKPVKHQILLLQMFMEMSTFIFMVRDTENMNIYAGHCAEFMNCKLAKLTNRFHCNSTWNFDE